MPRKRPTVVDIAGQTFEAVVLRIVEWNDDGSPKTLTTLRDHDSAHLSEHDETKNHFWIVYAPRDVKKPGQRTRKERRN